MRALGFCVSIEHARFMARVFGELGVRSTAVWGDSPEEERREALSQLRRGEINILFSVDLFNEGVDLPTVDTLLLLRPTDSATLFLQQLGRGLRKSQGKHTCLVLDFVGQHRREFRFDRRLRALLGGSRKNIERQVEAGFPFLPAGCHMELDRVARDIVLESIKRAVPAGWTAKANELRRLREEGRGSLERAFLEDSGLELEDVYAGNKSWSDLVEAVGRRGRSRPAPPRRRCAAPAAACCTWTMRRGSTPTGSCCAQTRPLPSRTPRAARPGSPACSWRRSSARRSTRKRASRRAWRSSGSTRRSAPSCSSCSTCWPTGSTTATTRSTSHPDVPLQVHARYTRVEILAAFQPQDRAKAPPWQTGCHWLPEEKADLFAFTLDKTSGQFSPTTRYRDYAISRSLIHWESQSVTRADSETGLRYRKHVEQGSSVMLFARLRQDERAFWFLGPATYVSHEGERPMAVTWRLEHPLPGDLFASFAAAVA